jgi:hypothetical protein
MRKEKRNSRHARLRRDRPPVGSDLRSGPSALVALNLRAHRKTGRLGDATLPVRPNLGSDSLQTNSLAPCQFPAAKLCQAAAEKPGRKC